MILRMKISTIFKRILHIIKRKIITCTSRTRRIAFIFSTVIILFGVLSLIQASPLKQTSQVAAEHRSGYKTASLVQTPIDSNTWQLLLVNPWNVIPAGYDVPLKELSGGHAVDERCYDALMEMLEDCRAAGLSPMICSSYRTLEKQEQLYNDKINDLTALGYSLKDAKDEAGRHVAVPGTSEHHLGLALDIVDENNQELDTSQEETPVQQWLMENSWKYGFILRYPNGKSDITGIIYEPWHYRYVGKEAAAEINEMDLCLEEYLGQADYEN